MEKNAFHSLLQLRSAAFNTEHIGQYALCFKLHGSIIEAVAFHVGDKMLVYYERFGFSKFLPIQEVWQQLVAEHAFLGAGYWQQIAILEPELGYVQVPIELFSTDLPHDLLNLHLSLNTEKAAISFWQHPAFNLVNVFAFNKEIASLVAGLYPLSTLRHAHVSDAILLGLHSMPEKLDYRYLHLFVNRNHLTIAFFRTGNLHLLNSYQFDTPEDLLYYVLFALTELGLEKDRTELLLWGDVGATFAGRLSILQQYFPLLSFGGRPKGIQYHYQFDELDNHVAFDLLAAYYLFV
ncbi:MAG: DUF3822 family protein [Cytophagales bacterium]|nr:DUF3822 family protein [Bernardetiaceae bacterium]MDW8204685.1 DUF3822 family protein [Cytophagales bacterium]